MPKIEKDVKTPGIGRMNTDTDDLMLEVNNVRLLKNGRMFADENGKDGVISNINGTKHIPNSYTASGLIIGATQNKRDQSIIYFFKNDIPSSGFADSIFEYFPKTDTIEVILKHNILNFSKEHRVLDAHLIGDLLYFNDGYNPPRKINIVKAKAYSQGNYTTGYPSIDHQTLSLIKYPPMNQMYPIYFTDTSKKTNVLRGSLFQFRYKYVYDDNEESQASFISVTPMPEGEVSFNGEVVGDLQHNNAIQLTLDTGHHTVSKLKVYYRNGNTGDWQLFETIVKEDLGLSDNAPYKVNFYNDAIVQPVDQLRINQPYDYIPLLSDRMVYLHTNNLGLAGITEGYGNTQLNTAMVGVREAVVPVAIGSETPVDTYPIAYETFQRQEYPSPIFVSGMLVSDLNVGNLPALGNMIEIEIEGHVESFLVTNEVHTDPETFRTTLCQVINTSYADYEATKSLIAIGGNPIQDDEIFVMSRYSSGYSCGPGDDSCEFAIEIREMEVVQSAYKPYPTFKSGATHSFGIVYYDEAGRSGFVNKANDIYLPFLNELESAERPTTHNYKYHINWAIKNRPPMWAHYYQWVYSKNTDILSFRQYVIQGLYSPTTPSGTDPRTIGVDKMTIDIAPLNQHKKQYNDFDYEFPGSSIEPWDFRKGDRVRFITKSKTDFSGSNGLGELLPYYLDVEILDYMVTPTVDVNGDPLLVDPSDPTTQVEETVTNSLIIQKIATATYPDIGENTLIEIYRPKKEQEELVYYEMGRMMKILNPGTSLRAHTGTYQDQLPTDLNQEDPSFWALGQMFSGDAYMVPTVFTKNLESTIADPEISIVESMSASNFYYHDTHNYGRPNIVNKEAKQEKTLTVRLSDKFFENTKINGLSTFSTDFQAYVSEEFGEITGAFEVGFTLKILQKYKNTSFYVGREGLQLATGKAGDELLSASGDAIGSKSPSIDRYGTINPESTKVIGRYAYFVDVLNGVIIRDAANGMIPISDKDISSDIKRICQEINNSDSGKVLTAYNPKTKEVLFSFSAYKNNVEEYFGTYIWNEEMSEWKGVMDYADVNGNAPHVYEYIGLDYVAFHYAGLWKFEAGDQKNTFFGNTVPIEINLVFNQNPIKGKLYKSLEYMGKGNWYCPDKGDLTIPEEYSFFLKKLESRLSQAQFKYVTGKHYAAIKKDMNTGGAAGNEINALINGRDMKGNLMYIRIINNDTTNAYISVISLIYQPLELS